MGSDFEIVRPIGKDGYMAALEGEDIFFGRMPAALVDEAVNGSSAQITGE